MSKENTPESHNGHARLPLDVYEQKAGLPIEEERAEICEELALKLFKLLSRNGIEIINVSFRIKSNEKIDKKIERRGRTAPLRDIYGARFITPEKDRAKIAKLIQDAFPATPEKFPDGMPSVREYADKETRDFVRSRYNPKISERHSAMHINVVFKRENSPIYQIAEVQILTPEEMKIFKETRDEYENGKH